MPRRLSVLLWVCAIALVAAACGSTSEPAEVSVGSSDTEATGDAASAPDESTSDAGSDDDADSSGGDDGNDEQDGGGDVDNGEPSMAASSPIGAFFADDGGFQTALEEYTLRVEEEIKLCMAAQGFEFAVTGTGGGGNEIQERQNDLSEREWTELYGYGISTSLDSVISAQTANPNAEIWFALSPSEREIWTETLVGPGNDISDIGGGNDAPLEERGCIGAALISTGGQGPLEGLEEFGAAYDEGEAAVYDTNEMIIAVGDWTQCMAEAGYPAYATVDAPEEEIGEEYGRITAPIGAALDEIGEDEARSIIEGDGMGVENLPGLDVDALRALQDREKKTAIADLDCYDVHVRETFEPLRDAFELGLMETYGAQLDALKNIGQ